MYLRKTHVFVFKFPSVAQQQMCERLDRARGYKTFFMLNSVKHEILKAHKYKNIKKFSFL